MMKSDKFFVEMKFSFNDLTNSMDEIQEIMDKIRGFASLKEASLTTQEPVYINLKDICSY